MFYMSIRTLHNLSLIYFVLVYFRAMSVYPTEANFRLIADKNRDDAEYLNYRSDMILSQPILWRGHAIWIT